METLRSFVADRALYGRSEAKFRPWASFSRASHPRELGAVLMSSIASTWRQFSGESETNLLPPTAEFVKRESRVEAPLTRCCLLCHSRRGCCVTAEYVKF